MRALFAGFVALHGVIHTLGFAKAFGFEQGARLDQPINRLAGVLWLSAAIGFVVSAILLLVSRRHWWIPAVPAVVLSQSLIITSFSDAKFGTIGNALILVPLALSLLDLRGSSLRSLYAEEVERGLRRTEGAILPALVTEADLAPLPALVQTYLRRVGVVGKPGVRNFHAVFRGQIRSKPETNWMSATVEQYSFYDEPGRLFFMDASRMGVPFDVLHRYVGPTARMKARVLGLIDVLDVSGPEMTQSETVTLFNDMCIVAPATLVGAHVTWQAVDHRRVKGIFSNAGITISAVLSFDDAGDLVGFVSDDRYQSDGKSHRLLPWSTPVGSYRDFGGFRLAAEGEARWREPTGEWTYGQFELQRISYNVGRP